MASGEAQGVMVFTVSQAMRPPPTGEASGRHGRSARKISRIQTRKSAMKLESYQENT